MTPIRCKRHKWVTIVALIFGPIFMLGPAAIGIFCFVDTGGSLVGVIGGVALCATSCFIAYHILENYHWIELDGDSIRAQRFWTRRIVEREIADISRIVPVWDSENPFNAEDFDAKDLDEVLAGTLNYRICFKLHGQSIGLVGSDMANVKPLILSLIERLEERRNMSS